MSKKIESHNNQIKEGMKKIQEIIEKLSFEDGNEMAFLNQFIPNTFPFIFSELECQMQELKSKLSKLQLGFLIEKLNEKIVILYLESYSNEESPCQDADCDNAGSEQVSNLRVLLADQNEIENIIEESDAKAKRIFLNHHQFQLEF